MHDRPPEKFVYEHHAVIHEKGNRLIILWAIKDGVNKLYKFPWTEKNEEALDQAKRNTERFGVPQIGEIVKEDQFEKRSRNNEFTLKTYKFPFQEMMPK